jgi:hypothetical protein
MRIYCDSFEFETTARFSSSTHGSIMDAIGWALEDLDEYRAAGAPLKVERVIGRIEGYLWVLNDAGAITDAAHDAAVYDIDSARIAEGGTK